MIYILLEIHFSNFNGNICTYCHPKKPSQYDKNRCKQILENWFSLHVGLILLMTNITLDWNIKSRIALFSHTADELVVQPSHKGFCEHNQSCWFLISKSSQIRWYPLPTHMHQPNKWVMHDNIDTCAIIERLQQSRKQSGVPSATTAGEQLAVGIQRVVPTPKAEALDQKSDIHQRLTRHLGLPVGAFAMHEDWR